MKKIFKILIILISYFIGILAICYMLLVSLDNEIAIQEKRDINYQSYINKNEIRN